MDGTPQDITDAVQNGEQFPAKHMVNPRNGATRYVNPSTGRSVTIGNKTKEVIHIGGEDFKMIEEVEIFTHWLTKACGSGVQLRDIP